MRFFNKRLDRIYKYLYIHDGETILRKDIARETKLCRPTVNKWLKWLEKRQLIKIDGKTFHILPPE